MDNVKFIDKQTDGQTDAGSNNTLWPERSRGKTDIPPPQLIPILMILIQKRLKHLNLDPMSMAS